MKKRIAFFYLLFPYCFLFSQQYQVVGRVLNLDSLPVEFAEIRVLAKDSTVIKGELTSKSGGFSFYLPKGFYVIQIKKIKNIAYSKDIYINNNNIILGDVKIDEVKSIGEVVLQKRRKLIERKVDKLIFNVENSISSIGGDAIDVLKVTPSIQVQNGQVFMIGKNNLSVMINDRSTQLTGGDLMNYLKTIRSDEIASIEIISNPSAKYDAEGKSGIINIKLKKNNNDFWNASFRSTYEQHAYVTGIFGGNFNYKKNKLSIQSNLVYTNGVLRPNETESIDYPQKKWTSNSLTKNYDDILTGKLGIDYKLNEKLTYGIQYIGGSSSPDITQKTFSNLFLSSGALLTQVNTELSNERTNQNHLLNAYAIYDIDSLGRKLSFNIDYLNFKKRNNLLFSTTTNNYENNTQDVTIKNNTGNQNIEAYSAKLDMDHPFKTLKLSYGGKITTIKTINKLFFFDFVSGVPIPDVSQNNFFKYQENIQALYIQGSEKFGKEMWEVQAGLRMESAQTIGTSVTNDQQTKFNYTEFFPSFYISYTPNENHVFSFDYGRRISRPKYSLLNPFRIYSNSYAYTEGNPLLKPSFVHNISFNHTYKGSLNSSFYYSRENNGYSMLTLIDKSSINQITTPINYYILHQFGINESYTFNQFSFWESYISANISYSRTISNNPSTENIVNGFGGDLSMTNSFILSKSKNLMSEIDLSYSFPTTFLNIRNKSVFNMDFSIKYLSLKKKLQLGLVIADVFGTNKQRWKTISNGINIYRTNYEDVRGVRLSLTYKFGNSKIKIKETKPGNTEELGRSKGD